MFILKNKCEGKNGTCLIILIWMVQRFWLHINLFSVIFLIVFFFPLSHSLSLPHSERLQTWEECSADRERNPWSLPQIPGDLPQPANPARTWGAPQDLWWGLVVFFLSGEFTRVVAQHLQTLYVADVAYRGGLTHGGLTWCCAFSKLLKATLYLTKKKNDYNIAV